MNAYSLLQSNPSLEAWQVDNSFDGNMCRCVPWYLQRVVRLV